MTKTGPVGPVQTGTFVTYTITVTNPAGAAGCTNIAQEADLVDSLPPELSFISLSIDDGFGGNNTACFSLPTPGTADAPIDCINTSMAPGTTTTYTLVAFVNNCLGAGVNVTNSVTVNTVSTDPDPSNNTGSWTFTTSEDGSCVDLSCDPSGCVPDLCTGTAANPDHCEAGVCVTTAVDCNDNSVCTADTCSPATGCNNDNSQLGALCDDFNDCTSNACDPLGPPAFPDFCVYAPLASGTACSDGLTCTTPDACDGLGACRGLSVCDDGNGCSDE